MRRALCLAVMSPIALIVFASAALADPAVELPAAACNQGTDHAFVVSSLNSNSPVRPHGNHGCHVHLP